MLSIRAIALLGVVVAGLAGCQTGQFCEKDQAAIGAASDDWFKQTADGKMAAVAAHYSEDAVLMPPGSPEIKGRKAIGEFFGHFPKLEKLQWKRAEVVGNGDLAYSMGSFSFEVNPPGAKKPVVEKGKYIEIWRRQADGSWLITRDVYNSDIAPQ